MNPRLEQPNIDVLSNILRDRQAEMRREAETARALGGTRATWPIRLLVALCVVVQIVLLLARTVAAAGAVGGGGFIHLAM